MKIIPEYPIRTRVEARTTFFVLNKINHENCHQKVTTQIRKKGKETVFFSLLLASTKKPRLKNNRALIKGGSE